VPALQRHVLIVEDDAAIRESLAEVLGSEGYPTQEASDGRAALSLLHVRPLPGCILLDLAMPVMDGATLVGELGVRPPLDMVPIVILSAQLPLPDARAGIRAAEWLEKPVTIERLLEVIRRYCGPPRGRTPPGGIPRRKVTDR
jgi:CheY-like chemotaxis protein